MNIFGKIKEGGNRILIGENVIGMMETADPMAAEAEQEEEDTVASRISREYDRLSKSQKKLAGFVLDQYDKATYLTAARVAKEVGTSESTVVRFAERLGYEGYPEFQEALRSYVDTRLSKMGRIDAKYGDSSDLEILHSVLNADVENLRDTKIHIESGAFSTAVDTILKAKTVYVAGVRNCAPLADVFCFYLNMIRGNVVKLSSSNPSEIFEQMIRIGGEDCLVGISFPRYSMRTLKAMEFANDRGARVVAVTDGIHSPMNLYSSCNLFARTAMVSLVDSITAPMSLINALIVAMCVRKSETVEANLKKMEEVWETYQVRESDEMDLLGEKNILGNHLWKGTHE